MNNFYTVLVIPEKTKQVKKVILPSVYVRVGLLLGSVGIFFLAFMVYDYVNVMRQLSENKRLQTENRQLKQQMQAFTTKLQTVQDALERIQSYTTKLRIITNQAGDNTENLKKKVAPDIPGLPMDDHSDLPPAKSIPSGRESQLHYPLAPWRLMASLDEDEDKKAALLLAENNVPADPSAPQAAPGDVTKSPVSPIVPPPVSSTAPAAPGIPVSAPVAPETLSTNAAPPATSVASSTSTSTARAKTRAAAKPVKPAEASAGSRALVKNIATSHGTSTSTSGAKYLAASSTATGTAVSSAQSSAVFTAAVSVSEPPAAPLDPPKKLSDLIREDEEQESAALRRDFAKLHLAFDSVLQHELSVELDVESLTTALLDQRDYMGSLPTLKPTNGWYTSGFGVRSSPFTGKSTMHEGLDLANHIGSAIVSAAAGVVTYAGPRPGYGNLVTINHGYGIQTQYGHISKAYVKVGEKIKRGQKVAAVGNTGRSTGPHVHYEVRVNGIPMDPYYYILED